MTARLHFLGASIYRQRPQSSLTELMREGCNLSGLQRCHRYVPQTSMCEERQSSNASPVITFVERKLAMTAHTFAIAAEKHASGPQMNSPTIPRPANQRSLYTLIKSDHLPPLSDLCISRSR